MTLHIKQDRNKAYIKPVDIPFQEFCELVKRIFYRNYICSKCGDIYCPNGGWEIKHQDHTGKWLVSIIGKWDKGCLISKNREGGKK